MRDSFVRVGWFGSVWCWLELGGRNWLVVRHSALGHGIQIALIYGNVGHEESNDNLVKGALILDIVICEWNSLELLKYWILRCRGLEAKWRKDMEGDLDDFFYTVF